MKGILKVFGVSFIFLIFFASCKKTEEAAYQTETEAKFILNLAYGEDAKQVMDVYLPQNRTSNTPIIIFVHGGSFIGGDKNEFNNHAKYLAASGYAVLNVNYRLVDASGVFEATPKHFFSAIKVKDQVVDISKIVDFAIAHTKEWVVNGNRIAMVGHSAGATLALLYAYGDRNTNKVQAVSNLAGALDMVFTNIPNWQFHPPYVFEGGYRFTGFEISVANEQHFKDISPFYVANSAKNIATLNVFPQNNDVLGLPKQDVSTYNAFTIKLNELKIKNEFIFVAGADHGFTQTGKWQLILDKTVAYFNANLN